MAKRRILIVHDDKVGVGELEARLTRLGYEAAAIASASGEAAQVATLAAPELVLMPAAIIEGTNGTPAADTAGRHGAIPVVFMGTQEDEAKLHSAGGEDAYGFIATPCTDRELGLAIELALCRHDAETAVHELGGFFAVSLDMFCFLDFSGYFRRLNPAWESTLGYTREELMSRPFIEFVHPDDRERTLKQNAEVRDGGRAAGFENRYLCKDGSYRWFLWNAAPQSEERVIYSVARDITARKNAELERAQLVSRLEATLAEVKTLRDILPICLYCRRIRDDEDYWLTVENYISTHTKTRFSHGICPSCMATEVEPHLTEFEDE